MDAASKVDVFEGVETEIAKDKIGELPPPAELDFKPARRKVYVRLKSKRLSKRAREDPDSVARQTNDF